MENEKLETLLIDYIDGKLTEEEWKEVDQELKRNPEAKRKYEQLQEVIHTMENSARIEPSTKLKLAFDQLLQNEISEIKSGKVKVLSLHPAFYRAAAAVAVVVLAGGIGFWINNQQRQINELEAMRKEMDATKQMLMTMLDNQHSASQRVLGATVAFNEVENADDQIVGALIQAMNEDQNTNVRIAALEALGKFRARPDVRKALIASLKTQKDPIVQIALIHLMVEMKEKGITEELKRISTDEEVLPAVKDEAYAGILRLS